MNFPSWIDQKIVSFLPVRWYSLMYLVAFVIAYFLFRNLCKKKGFLNGMDSDTGITLLTFAIVGLLLGGRILSCILYDTDRLYYITHPWMIFWPFVRINGKLVFTGLQGMSYHGGIIGGCIGGLLFAKKYRYKFLDLADTVFACVPLGYTFGRIGNFINGELWGRCTNSSFGVIFPHAPKFPATEEWVRTAADRAGISYSSSSLINLPRHPSQLYEAAFEGIVLFLIIWFAVIPYVRKRKIGRGFIVGSYFAGYGLIRFVLEYFREPDQQLGYIIKLGKNPDFTYLFTSVLNISLGQILCFMMVCAGFMFMYFALHTEPTEYGKKRKKK